MSHFFLGVFFVVVVVGLSFSAGVASSAAGRVVRSCVMPQRGGRLAGRPGHAELEEDKPNSLFPLVP